MELQLRISGSHYNTMKQHLLPSDGMEAVVVALCGRYSDDEVEMLLVHDLICIPYDACERSVSSVTWSTEFIMPFLKKISHSDLAIVKIHSHPNSFSDFSKTDDISDHELFASVFGWAINLKPHASVVMLPDGKLFGRMYFSDLSSQAIEKINIAGDLIKSFSTNVLAIDDDFGLRNRQAFGDETYSKLKALTIGVVGCSGTGSPVIEQLVRLGVGKLVLIDPDIIEAKNLNRIINSTSKDASLKTSKVEVLANAIYRIGLGTKVELYQNNLYDNVYALRSLLKCDLIIGCMDSVDGRFLLNQLSTFYIVPYLDLGVKLEADGSGGITKICGTVHYIQPGGSSLITRNLFSIEDLRAASQFRKNPEEFAELAKHSYIKNINVNSPAVISVNMAIASMGVNELLNRLHNYKAEPPQNYAVSTLDLTESCIINIGEDQLEPDEYLKKKVGRGNIKPFLEISEINDGILV